MKAARHTFTMFDTVRNDGANTTVAHEFYADALDQVVEEFKYYLWHCGYSYVADVKVVTEADEPRIEIDVPEIVRDFRPGCEPAF